MSYAKKSACLPSGESVCLPPATCEPSAVCCHVLKLDSVLQCLSQYRTVPKSVLFIVCVLRFDLLFTSLLLINLSCNYSNHISNHKWTRTLTFYVCTAFTFTHDSIWLDKYLYRIDLYLVYSLESWTLYLMCLYIGAFEEDSGRDNLPYFSRNNWPLPGRSDNIISNGISTFWAV